MPVISSKWLFLVCMEAEKPEEKFYVADNLRELRLELRLSQKAFGELFGWGRGNVNNYERGMIPPFPTLLAICRRFNLDLEAFTTQQGLIHARQVPGKPLPMPSAATLLETFELLNEGGKKEAYEVLLAKYLDLKSAIHKLNDLL